MPMGFLCNFSAEPAIEAEREEELHIDLEIHEIVTRNPSDLPEIVYDDEEIAPSTMKPLQISSWPTNVNGRC
jgi:hypothetical protein